VPNAGVNSFARAGFSDTLTPSVSGVLHVDFVITGILFGNTGAAGGWLAADGIVKLGTRGEVDSCASTGPFVRTYAFDFLVSAGVPFQLSAAIEAGVDGSTLDLSNTATLRASGVPFTSDSGVFLTAIPEPSLLLLLGPGWAGFIGAHGRRRS